MSGIAGLIPLLTPDIEPIPEIAPTPPVPAIDGKSIPLLGFSGIVTSITSTDPRWVIGPTTEDPGHYVGRLQLQFSSTNGNMSVDQSDPTSVKFTVTGGGTGGGGSGAN